MAIYIYRYRYPFISHCRIYPHTNPPIGFFVSQCMKKNPHPCNITVYLFFHWLYIYRFHDIISYTLVIKHSYGKSVVVKQQIVELHGPIIHSYATNYYRVYQGEYPSLPRQSNLASWEIQ